MIQLREEHMEAFGQHMEKLYQKRLFEALKPEFPKTFEKSAPDRVEEFIQAGVERAKSYGIASEKDIYQFLRLMFANGRDFDLDENLPWSAVILKEKETNQKGPTINTLLDVCDYMVYEKEGITI